MVAMAPLRFTPVLVVVFALGAELHAQAMPTPTTRDLIEVMRARRGTDGPQTRTLVLETINYRSNGTVDTTTWYQAMMPGRLRIDIPPLEAGNGILWIGGMRYVIRGFEVADSGANVNPQLLLFADLLGQPVDRTLFVLDSIGIDTMAIDVGMWDGETVAVVGAEAGDDEADQFWVDVRRMVPVRLLQKLGAQRQAQLDARIGGYQEIDGRWVETEVKLFVNGQLWQEEHYSGIRVGVELDPAVFDPEQWRLETPYWK
jgi:hypothetical protein